MGELPRVEKGMVWKKKEERVGEGDAGRTN
jgi:hypothetical protein